MKHLYKIEMLAYVMAENSFEAEHLAVRNAPNILCEAYPAHCVDGEWWDWIPFGADDDRTCGQILQAEKVGKDG